MGKGIIFAEAIHIRLHYKKIEHYHSQSEAESKMLIHDRKFYLSSSFFNSIGSSFKQKYPD